jgi:hypothetical protein
MSSFGLQHVDAHGVNRAPDLKALVSGLHVQNSQNSVAWEERVHESLRLPVFLNDRVGSMSAVTPAQNLWRTE